ncbi:hypothetical protein [Paraburkholderia caribensis]|nr:hypothetical protein [Paraburkholderia caribensis]
MAARSTEIALHNETDFPLVKIEDGLESGEWTDPWYPPAIIEPHRVGEWRSESDGFMTGTEGHVRYQFGSSGVVRSHVSAVSRKPGNLDLFFVGEDGVVHTSWLSEGQDWSGITGWRRIGGVFPSNAPIAAVARRPDNLDLFVVGNDGVVYTSWLAPGADWSGLGNKWRPIGGVFPAGAPIAAVARRPDNLDLFVVGNDGLVYTSWLAPGADWSGLGNKWRAIGGVFPVGAPIAAVARRPDNLDLFVVGNDGLVYTSWLAPGADWSGLGNKWRAIGGVFPVGGPIAAVARRPDNLDLFVVGNDGLVYTSWLAPGADWSGLGNKWRPIGGVFPAGAPIAAVARKPDNLDLFVVGNDGVVYTSWLAPGADWSGLGNKWRAIGGVFPVGAPIAAVARTADNLDLFVAGQDRAVYTSWWTAMSDWSGVNNNWRLIGGGFVYFHWNNPFESANKYHLFPSPGLQAVRHGGSGNNTRVEITVRVAAPHHAGDFKPSRHGFHFANSFGDVPYSLPPLRGSLLDYKYGNAKNGLCAGMVFAVRDYFEFHVPIPDTRTLPAGEEDPLFNYIVSRLFDSFTVADVSLYLKYMHPLYPDTDENLASPFGLADGRASVVINTEWPIIRDDIDAGHPSPLSLVTIRSALPTDLGKNHQVLAYKYIESGTDVTLWVYDPNQPDNDNVTIAFSTLAWDRPINITHNVSVWDEDQVRRPIYCLFRSNYSPINPAAELLLHGSGMISSVARAPNNLDLFVIRKDGVVCTSWLAPGADWSGVDNNWRPIGGVFPISAPVAAVARTPNNLDLFVVGNDGVVYTSWLAPGADWSGLGNKWRPIGGVFPAGAPIAAVGRRPDNLDLFVVGNDGLVYTSWLAPGADWSGLGNKWRAIGGVFPVGAPIAAVARRPDNLDLFVVGTDGLVYTSWLAPGADWSGLGNKWRAIGGVFPVGGPIAAVARRPDNLDLFVVGNDGLVYTSWLAPGADWSGLGNKWRPIGGVFPAGAPIAAVARKPDDLDLFVVGNDGVVYTSWLAPGADWSGLGNKWRAIGGVFPVGASIGVTARTPDNLDLFVLGNDGVVYTSWWSAGADWSGVENKWRPIGGYFPTP